MLKSRLNAGGAGAGAGEAPSARDRLSRFAGVKDEPQVTHSDPLDNLKPEPEVQEEGYVDDGTRPEEGEAQGDLYVDAAAQVQAQSSGEGVERIPAAHPALGAGYGEKAPRKPRQATKPEKMAKAVAAPSYTSAAEVRQAMKEHEADVKAMRLRHDEELQRAKAKHVELSGKLFDFVSQ